MGEEMSEDHFQAQLMDWAKAGLMEEDARFRIKCGFDWHSNAEKKYHRHVDGDPSWYVWGGRYITLVPTCKVSGVQYEKIEKH